MNNAQLARTDPEQSHSPINFTSPWRGRHRSDRAGKNVGPDLAGPLTCCPAFKVAAGGSGGVGQFDRRASLIGKLA